MPKLLFQGLVDVLSPVTVKEVADPDVQSRKRKDSPNAADPADTAVDASERLSGGCAGPSSAPSAPAEKDDCVGCRVGLRV